METMPSSPETYLLKPTPHVPNSALPVLVYRSALPVPHDQTSAKIALEGNDWIKGGVFHHYPTHHFHSVTHECYAVFAGSSRFLLGRGPLDDNDDERGVEVQLNAGDVMVQPAGVAHCCLQSTKDFSYLGVYPKHAPKWDNNFCRADVLETREKATVAHAVPIPLAIPSTDPMALWSKFGAELLPVRRHLVLVEVFFLLKEQCSGSDKEYHGDDDDNVGSL